MKTEYKRDMNHNYLILYGEEEINTDSYQVRMLVGNIISLSSEMPDTGNGREIYGVFRYYIQTGAEQII